MAYPLDSSSEPEKESQTLSHDINLHEQVSKFDDNLYCPDVDTSGVDERKLIRRIDWHIVPWVAVLYLLNFLDRGNIGNAKVGLSYRSPRVAKNLTERCGHY